MNLTKDEIDVLAHVVINPQAWADAAEANPKVDEKKVLEAKVKRWRPEYNKEKVKSEYKTRAVKQTQNDAQEKQAKIDRLAVEKQRRQKGEQDLNIKIAAEVTKQLAEKINRSKDNG